MLIAYCDDLKKGLPEPISGVWPLAIVQECVLRLVRCSLRYAFKAHWSAITKTLRIVYTASTVEAAEARFAESEEVWVRSIRRSPDRGVPRGAVHSVSGFSA